MSVDLMWSETVVTWNSYIGLSKVSQSSLCLLLNQAKKISMLLQCFEQIGHNQGCDECQRLAMYLILRYTSTAPELLRHERFHQIILGKISHAAENGIFVGHLFGIEQPSQSSLQDLIGKVEENCGCGSIPIPHNHREEGAE